jgi:hypothetical protein
MSAPLRSGERPLVGRVLRIFQLPPREILTMLHVAAVMTFVELLIRWVPLMTLSRLLGVRVNLAPVPPGAEPMSAAELPPAARRQLRCTRRVADAWPLSRGPCLRRSLVAGHLLRDHDPAVRLGVARSGHDLLAHAWLEIDDRPLESVTNLQVFHEARGGTLT